MVKGDWIKNVAMQTWFIIIGIFFLWLMDQTGFDPKILILTLSLALLVFPLTLLGIFTSSNVRESLKRNYFFEREHTLSDIRVLRRKQEGIEDIEKLINIDQEILALREGMRLFKDNRFERCITYSLILFMITITLTFFDLGSYINTSNSVVLVVFFLWGLYYIFQMIGAIFFSFDDTYKGITGVITAFHGVVDDKAPKKKK